MTVRCFSGAFTNDAFRAHLSKAKEQIAKLTPKEMDRTSRDEWVDYFVGQYTIEPLVIFSDSMDIDVQEKTVKKYNPWSQHDPYEPEYYEVPGILARCVIPYSGNPGLFEMQATISISWTYDLDMLDKPDSSGIGHMHLSTEMSQDEMSAEKVRGHFSEEVGRYKRQADNIDKDVSNFNSSLRAEVEKAVDKRIEQLDKFVSLRRDLNLPLQAVKDAPLAKPLILRQSKVVSPKPQPSETEYSYSVTDADYHAISTIIDKFGASMERTPGSFIPLGEEQLRDHLLSVLSTHYDYTSGETFRNHGKTDIHIPFDNYSAYIAECKVWHGKKKFLDAIEQLFSYTTWRDTKVSVIVFNKEVSDFQKVLSSIQEALDKRAIGTKRLGDHTMWSCRIQNDKDGRIMHATVHAFNLYYSGHGKTYAKARS